MYDKKNQKSGAWRSARMMLSFPELGRLQEEAGFMG
jgi:hypothetical protein